MISKITKVLIALGLIGSIAACQSTGTGGGDQTTPEGGTTPTEEPADGGTGTETAPAPEGGGTEGGQ